MSELLGDLEVEFPKSVTACHAELRRLGMLLDTADKQLDTKEETIDELQGELDDIEEKGIVHDSGIEDAIHRFLDECERTGPLRYDVPQSERANRAIATLHSMVGRNP